MAQEYPPISFYFKLSFSGVIGAEDPSFTEVAGISMEMGVEEIIEGGNNNFKHRVPTSVKFSNLVLKRGLVPKNSEVISWCKEILEGGLAKDVETKDIIVQLINENGDPLKSWSFINALPVKCEVSSFNSIHKEILIESLEFAYNSFTEITSPKDTSNDDFSFNLPN
ncbi:phage tail protein [Rasiella rasia]|uniref:Phage tail protein n=1 Tax=Rasiella rasia TaxID=2744027 RepID=A0A6G6GMJ8_9FLAO|nr:phage tail protein [Rasiella rasia]QIE59779.1 phage tail protein [Rasiella rasia]